MFDLRLRYNLLLNSFTTQQNSKDSLLSSLSSDSYITDAEHSLWCTLSDGVDFLVFSVTDKKVCGKNNVRSFCEGCWFLAVWFSEDTRI